MLKVKKCGIVIVFLFCISFILSGCEKSEENTMEKIQKQLTEMESCKCTASLTRFSNKGEKTYEVKQLCKTDGKYRLEITSPERMKGNFTVFDGEEILQYNARTGETFNLSVPEAKNGDELFFCSFVKNYLQSENVVADTAVNLDESRCTMLEAVIPGGNRYVSTEKVWIDNETLKPLKFIIYDIDGNERYAITYNEFEYNPETDDSDFRV